MSVLPFASAPQPDYESNSPLERTAQSVDNTVQPATSAPPETSGHGATNAERPASDPGQQVRNLKRRLEDAAAELGRLQSSFDAQHNLEQLLRQGRTHLQDLRARLQQATDERDRLQSERERLEGELAQRRTSHEREIERLQSQIEEAARQAFLDKTLAEQRARDLVVKEEEHREQAEALRLQLQKSTADRERLSADLEEREAAYKRFADERSEERATFERLLAEATANQRDMVQELDDQRQQIQTLRETAMRAQSLAREIMRAHEKISLDPPN